MSLAESKNIKWRISLTDYWFGDSWVYGDELDDPSNECFAKLASDAIGTECINLGERATSIDSIVYKFLSIKDQIKPNDNVFFFLTDSNRITIDNKNLLAGAWEDCTPNLHPYNKYWYKYFDSSIQRQNNLDRNLLLLHSACPQAKFCNIFSYNTSIHLDPTAWILPSDQCIAQTILPHVHKGMVLTDHPELLVEEWQEQEPYVKKYFASGGHPNKLGHKKIAEELCKLI
jgi:hypothetical protein